MGVYADIRYQDGTALLDQTIILDAVPSHAKKIFDIEGPKPIQVVMVILLSTAFMGRHILMILS